ncbi:hypothetical protein CEE39_08540 [bacterium (candidate division B38) B3_B38]|nr:MAG: hypothetical protein CEE39_08540 [bacterium (candidate division B38) B3_B38]
MIREGVLTDDAREQHLPPPLFAANKEAWELYCILQDQFRVLGLNARKREVKALDLGTVSAVLELYQVEDKPSTLEKILLIFHEMNR